MLYVYKKIALLVFLLIIGFGWFSYSSEHSTGNVSIKTMFDEAFLSKLKTPKYVWLENGKALLLDFRVEPEKRTFEIFDPRNGRRESILDPSPILAFFKKNLAEEAPKCLEWPDAIDSAGKRAIYILGGDLFLVNLKNSKRPGEVKRLTQTPSPEESVTFSPDDQWISFIRDNDIYIIDTKTWIEKRLTADSSDTLMNGRLSWVYWEEIYNNTSIPYFWAPDSSAIAYLQTDDSPVSISTFVHFKPATQEVVQQRYPKAGQPNPKVRSGIVDINSAKTTWMDCGYYEYIARFNWLPNSKAIAVQTLNRNQSELKLWIADRKTGKAKTILVERHLYRVKLNGKGLKRISEGDGVHAAEFSPGMNYYLDTYSNFSQPSI